MPHRLSRASAIASLCTFACAAQAQPARPDPLDPAASVPSMRHESALRTYKPSGETKPVPWPDANANVERIGGWRAYARDAAAGAPAPAAAAPGAPPPHKH
jgi:hypothetical protein